MLDLLKPSPLLWICCNCCGAVFHLCSCCYRGQVYCSQKCRTAGYRQIHSEAQKQYRQTEKGKKQHCEAEKRRRKRSKSAGIIEKTISKTCMCLSMILQFLFKKDVNEEGQTKCSICGKPGISVDAFPRRGYGKTRYNPGSAG